MKKLDEVGIESLSEPIEARGLSAGRALRDQVFNKLTPILLCSGFVADAEMRRNLQGSCHEIVNAIEDLIRTYDLDLLSDRVKQS